MIPATSLASSPLVRAILFGLAGCLGYVLVAGILSPGSLHAGAAVVVGLTIGVHTYRRASTVVK